MTRSGDKKRVLVLCTGNSCRSQMAEGFVNRLLAGEWEARSAGTHPAERVHPLAVKVMTEAGVDISSGVPEVVDRYLDEAWDLVVTVCDSAKESCPAFPRRVEAVHIPFDDPADAEGTDEDKMAVFRRVRDEIRDRLIGAVAGRG